MVSELIVQAVWDWRIAAETLLGGTGAVVFILATIMSLWKPTEHRTMVKSGIIIAAPLAISAVLILMTEIGRQERMFLIFRNLNSMISTGSVFLTAFIALGLATTALLFMKWEKPMRALMVINSLIAVGVILYPGFIFGAVKAIPSWGTAVMPVLILFTSVLTGIAVITLWTAGAYFVKKGRAEQEAKSSLRSALVFTDVSIGAAALQIITVLSYLVILGRGPTLAVEAYQLVMGPLAALFWGGVVAVGLVAPLVLLPITKMSWMKGERALLLVVFASVLILVGGILLRVLILEVGVTDPLFPPEPLKH